MSSTTDIEMALGPYIETALGPDSSYALILTEIKNEVSGMKAVIEEWKEYKKNQIGFLIILGSNFVFILTILIIVCLRCK